MFGHTFLPVVSAVFQVLLLAASGYFLVKIRILDQQGLNQLSNLAINFLFPLFIYFQMTNHFRFQDYTFWWGFPLIGLGVAVIGYVLGKIVSQFSKQGVAENEFISLVTFQNAGYLPLMIVTALFPQGLREQFYVYILLFVITFNLIIFTWGVNLIIQRKTSATWREIFNPPVVAIIFSLIVIFFGWHHAVPQSVATTVEMFGNCTLPLSMLVVGGSLALISIRDFHRTPMALLVMTKLVLMPLIALAVVLLLKLDFKLGFLIVLESAMPSAVNLSVLANFYNVEGKFINQGIFFTHVASMVTLPIFLAVYLMLVPA